MKNIIELINEKYKPYQFEGYLTEDKLGQILKLICPEANWIHNRSVPNSNSRYRPDFRSDKLMMIFEFDGHLHYTNIKTQRRDIEKNKIYSNMGYKIYRIPYFEQLGSDKLYKIFYEYYLNIEKSNPGLNIIDGLHKHIRKSCLTESDIVDVDYPFGFIDKTAITPCDFNITGVNLFLSNVKSYSDEQNSQIAHSIVNSMTNINEIHPKILEYLKAAI